MTGEQEEEECGIFDVMLDTGKQKKEANGTMFYPPFPLFLNVKILDQEKEREISND